jgi:hypothetical protein
MLSTSKHMFEAQVALADVKPSCDFALVMHVGVTSYYLFLLSSIIPSYRKGRAACDQVDPECIMDIATGMRS